MRPLRGFPITLRGEMLVELERRIKTLEYETENIKERDSKDAVGYSGASPHPLLSCPSAAKKITLDEAHRGAASSFKRRRLFPPMARSIRRP
jgi:hypothetical protein